MSKSKPVFSSSIGKKLIMSLTGIFLCLFLVVHLVGNLQLFKDDAGLAFNKYAYFMTHFTPIKVVSYLLYASVIVHVIYAITLSMKNKAARPIGYAKYDGQANSKWNSRNMGILGTVILVFLATHMSNFWWKFHNDEVPYIEYRTDLATGQTTARELQASEFHDYQETVENNVQILKARDLYKQVDFAFQNIALVALYVIAMAALAFHLIHGFQSAFQTLGFNHRRYIGIIRVIGVWVFGVLIPIGFVLMPLFFFFK
ncbi:MULTISPECIES: succinate dehydrogenase cytochrome b subunit [Sphingobacterium]|jgi:succinate dehydrogenase / fumarate reductase, cytochrome b subunit|uniref:Succinate dehydrogenase (Or fumarate reductase) cytochrome b subunit, b558 family n=1 Tax=Sphingobacterium multivorum TaxID=28454 RepID=A0A2X2JB96_SPHMU|nr:MULTISPECIES: succinate dehydrogenase cytochrome b subunit [Sphingobacterium]HAE67572.1 succinate dehydrogenase [Sphingobacterium sp.]OJZ03415.1 MAG: succinate dehydrogenase [Sphingobacterium sp. 40-24]QRQ61530.1 succinate dehydrogenase cytochrome b subunit [Sphingobacterium multivorum]SPZ84385.1 succinate dehydrogenase (or fumarate reductase) cytochrome b subunit, b558 family [Sphingobacterium multivorum]HBI89970.1 succinate dehydrogenase [Sphingobacterium sp.]